MASTSGAGQISDDKEATPTSSSPACPPSMPPQWCWHVKQRKGHSVIQRCLCPRMKLKLANQVPLLPPFFRFKALTQVVLPQIHPDSLPPWGSQEIWPSNRPPQEYTKVWLPCPPPRGPPNKRLKAKVAQIPPSWGRIGRKARK